MFLLQSADAVVFCRVPQGFSRDGQFWHRESRRVRKLVRFPRFLSIASAQSKQNSPKNSDVDIDPLERISKGDERTSKGNSDSESFVVEQQLASDESLDLSVSFTRRRQDAQFTKAAVRPKFAPFSRSSSFRSSCTNCHHAKCVFFFFFFFFFGRPAKTIFILGRALSPRADGAIDAAVEVQPSEKNVESLSTVVRNLGVENAQLIKQNKELTAKVEQLQLEIARMQQEVAQAHSDEARMRQYTARLGQAVRVRRDTENRVKQAQTKSKYGLYHAQDDSQFDFGKATPHERREWILQLVGHRRDSSSSDRISRRLSTTATMLQSLPKVIEPTSSPKPSSVKFEKIDEAPESARSETGKPSQEPEHSTPQTQQPPSPTGSEEGGDHSKPRTSSSLESGSAPSSVRENHGDDDELADSSDHAADKKKDKTKKSKDKDKKGKDKDKKEDKVDKSKDSGKPAGKRQRGDTKRSNTYRKSKTKAPETDQVEQTRPRSNSDATSPRETNPLEEDDNPLSATLK